MLCRIMQIYVAKTYYFFLFLINQFLREKPLIVGGNDSAWFFSELHLYRLHFVILYPLIVTFFSHNWLYFTVMTFILVKCKYVSQFWFYNTTVIWYIFVAITLVILYHIIVTISHLWFYIIILTYNSHKYSFIIVFFRSRNCTLYFTKVTISHNCNFPSHKKNNKKNDNN